MKITIGLIIFLMAFMGLAFSDNADFDTPELRILYSEKILQPTMHLGEKPIHFIEISTEDINCYIDEADLYKMNKQEIINIFYFLQLAYGAYDDETTTKGVIEFIPAWIIERGPGGAK